MRKVGRRVFCAVRGKRILAYALARSWGDRKRSGWSVQETAGAPEGVLSLYRWFASRPGSDQVRGEVPFAPLPYLQTLFGATDFWRSSIGCLGQIKVVDRRALLQAFRLGSLDRAVSGLRWNGLEETRLLFGPLPPRAILPPGSALRALDRRLPLPFYLWPSDHV
jgi:hypothetical protein